MLADVSALHADAEEVRAYLCTLRGGAPLLSPTDGHLLVTWLEAGISVGAILRGLDRAARRHRAKRIRAPLTLRHAREFLKAESGRRASTVPLDLPDRLAGDDVRLHAVRERIAALVEPDPEARARAACAVARAFFDDLWRDDDALRATLWAEAEAELADLRDALDELAWSTACEDLARYRLRMAYPTLSATRIWEECGLGG